MLIPPCSYASMIERSIRLVKGMLEDSIGSPTEQWARDDIKESQELLAKHGASDTVTITRIRYEHLIRHQVEMIALDSAGVDNWEWYGEIDWEACEEKAKEQAARYQPRV